MLWGPRVGVRGAGLCLGIWGGGKAPGGTWGGLKAEEKAAPLGCSGHSAAPRPSLPSGEGVEGGLPGW